MSWRLSVSLRAVGLIGLLSGCARAPRGVVPEPVLPSHDEPRELAVDQQAKQLLNRFTYGPRPGSTELLVREGLDRWLVRQLTPENWDDQGGDSAIAHYPVVAMRVVDLVDASPPLDVFLRRRRATLGLPDTAAYTMTSADSGAYKAMTELGNRRVQAYLGAKLARAVASDHQLLEVMTDFWENHFSVSRAKMPTQFTLLAYDRDIIRPHALGRFRDLLGAVAHSPAMLYYLDNVQSAADAQRLTLTAWRQIADATTSAAAARLREAANRRRGGLNENYGRELLELHTLGVDGGYTQADVQAVARALTGWTLAKPREGGAFAFNANTHDAEEKVVLGHHLAAGRGEEDGEEVLDILARHPSTARFIATKLVRHFVADSAPPPLVRRVAQRYVETDGDIRAMLAVIATSPELYRKAAFRAKVKTPYELVASTYRVMHGTPDTLGRSVQLAASLGQPLFGHLTPDGWPDDAESWMNTGSVLNRINFASTVAAGRVPGIAPSRAPFWQALLAAPTAAQVDGVAAALLQSELSSDTRAVLLSGVNPLAAPNGDATRPDPRRPPTLADLVGLALGSPEFQRR